MPSKAEVIVKKIKTLLDSLVTELGNDTHLTTGGDMYRISPGGPLNARGVAELQRLFEENYPSVQIARMLDISLSGVTKRRSLWAQGKPLKTAFRYGHKGDMAPQAS